VAYSTVAANHKNQDLPKYDQKTGESWAPLEIEGLGPGKECLFRTSWTISCMV